MIINEAKIYDREYVEQVLGIKIPLNESLLGYSHEFREMLIREHLLFEQFMNSLRQFASRAGQAVAGAARAAGQAAVSTVNKTIEKAKETPTQVKNLAYSLYYIMSDPSKLGKFIDVIKTKSEAYIKFFKVTFAALDKFFSEAILKVFPVIKTLYQKIKDQYEKIKDAVVRNVEPLIKGLAGWKGALTGIAVFVFVVWLWDKIKKIVPIDKISKLVQQFMELYEKISDEIKVGGIILGVGGKLKLAAAGASLAAGQGKEKAEDEIKDAAYNKASEWIQSTGILEQVKNLVTNMFQSIIGQATYAKMKALAVGAVASIAGYLAGLAAIFGGIAVVAAYINPITSTFVSQVKRAAAAPAAPPQSTASPAAPQPQTVAEHANIRTLLRYLNE